MVLLLSLLACAPIPQGHDCDLSGPHLVVGTTDFVGGALAAVTPGEAGEAPCVAPALVTAGADAVVRVTDDRTWVVQRTGGDTLLGFGHGAYDLPEVEVVVAPEGNAHDLVQVGDELLLSLYDEARIAVLDLDGRHLDDIDLSAHADADGLPEVDRIVTTDAGVFASLQRLDRDADWRGGPGQIVALDVPGRAVTQVWETGPNPRLAPAADGRRLVVVTGHYFEADGGLSLLDPSQAELPSPVVTEDEAELDLASVADDLVLGTAFEVGGASVIGRWGDAGLEPLVASDAWFVDALAVPGGVVVASTVSKRSSPEMSPR